MGLQAISNYLVAESHTSVFFSSSFFFLSAHDLQLYQVHYDQHIYVQYSVWNVKYVRASCWTCTNPHKPDTRTNTNARRHRRTDTDSLLRWVWRGAERNGNKRASVSPYPFRTNCLAMMGASWTHTMAWKYSKTDDHDTTTKKEQAEEEEDGAHAVKQSVSDMCLMAPSRTARCNYTISQRVYIMYMYIV